jgi:sensor histidine kinase regulating citrate/malate metabolism
VILILKPKNVIFIVLSIFLVAMSIMAFYFELNSIKSILVISITITIIYLILNTYLNKVFEILDEQKKTITDKFILLNSITDGVYGIDRTNKCIFINKAALVMLEQTKSQVLYKDYHILFSNYQDMHIGVFEQLCRNYLNS